MVHRWVVAIVWIALTSYSVAEAASGDPVPAFEVGALQLSEGTRAALLQRESAGPDTFDLYGGPRRIVRDPDGVPGNGDEYVEGKFEDLSGLLPSGLGPEPGNWTGVDLTDNQVFALPRAGEWSSLFRLATDLDPCRSNVSPQVGFVDFGQTPPNAPGSTGTTSTGGSLSATWDYGIPGGWVVNYTGGLDGVPVRNEVWSPEIVWDLPGTDDDGIDVYGADLRFRIWRHNPLANGLFYVWHVRSYANGAWGDWEDRNLLYFSANAEYRFETHALTGLVPSDVEKIQVAVGVADFADVYDQPGADGTPAPWFDDVHVRKYRVGGPSIVARAIDLANDGFPVNGSIDASTPALRDELDVRFDMASDVNSVGELYVFGDSVVVDAAAVIPGTSLASLEMKWTLRPNPFFEDAIRQAPAGDFEDTVDGAGNRIWRGAVATQECRTVGGTLVQGRYFADLPDEDFLYPGDVLHYHFEAIDSDGRVTTLPADLDGFGEWDANGRSPYARTWTVRALPSIADGAGAQPSILIYDDAGRGEEERRTQLALDQLGMREGIDYDAYATQGASSSVSNGIGSSGVVNVLGDRRGHGASSQQLAGYSTIVYMAGELGAGLLSDGTNDGANDKSPDMGVLTAWKNLTGRRATVYFGDHVASALVADSPTNGATYLATVMGAESIAADVRPSIDGQTAPVVRPTGAAFGFVEDFVAYGGCNAINQFDHIRARTAAARAHGFVDPTTGQTYTDSAAGVIYDRLVAGHRKIDVTFPFGFQFVTDAIDRVAPQASARAALLEEIFVFLGHTVGAGAPVATPSPGRASLSVHPTPFNPTTVVRFALPRAGVAARVDVLDVRGQRVRVLHDGVASSADLQLRWDGTDARGRSVASGVYFVRAATEGFAATRKAVLVK